MKLIAPWHNYPSRFTSLRPLVAAPSRAQFASRAFTYLPMTRIDTPIFHVSHLTYHLFYFFPYKQNAWVKEKLFLVMNLFLRGSHARIAHVRTGTRLSTFTYLKTTRISPPIFHLSNKPSPNFSFLHCQKRTGVKESFFWTCFFEGFIPIFYTCERSHASNCSQVRKNPHDVGTALQCRETPLESRREKYEPPRDKSAAPLEQAVELCNKSALRRNRSAPPYDRSTARRYNRYPPRSRSTTRLN